MQRRHVLALGTLAATGAVTATARQAAAADETPAAAPTGHQHAAAAGAVVDPGVEPFTVRMPVPRVLRPTRVHGDHDFFEHVIRPAEVGILPGRRTAALTFGGSFVAPTIRVKAGRRARIKFVNRLGEPANVHLHGGHVAPGSDGYPTDPIAPGASRIYDYPNRQAATTLWYHDHTHHQEAEHVYRGMHGFYLIESDAEKRMGLPSDEFDVPLMIRDAAFDGDGQLVFDLTVDPAASRLVPLANGKVRPFFPVAARRYRFRILNASNHRTFHLTLGGAPMTQIGSDGGLLPRPVPLTELALSPAERADVVVDFGGAPAGTRFVLDSTDLGPILRFDVTRRAHDTSRVPPVLRTMPPLAPAVREREIVLDLGPEMRTFTIDGKTFDPDRVDAVVKRGTTEIWKIRNATTVFGPVDHVFHMHLVQFRVLDRDGAPPPPGETGYKDTVHIPGGTSVRVQATFTDFVGRYVYHCHMMEHASMLGMMAQMEIVP
ncbi:FtsP/CotA-like multicopper oxidase with cupredoxin domain [Krasilnikovia cinnamomea]|uniref:FtsP/CotA-like multicopper oxidase with cupredoxin domain n=1 Tax=Krasilnikovia cinnamomea TaxID=349313 RepID=A0A4V2G7X2_9ACTN|nr:multicopper oxidase family protein [Krasilnikovia cinnamomea]RZU54196.1 FtsP/CotA-like multicopper oxidase with cupredoxin domain [Krasilnikovia cinnamomea]